MKIAFLTQTRTKNLKDCNSYNSIIESFKKYNLKKYIYLVLNHQVDNIKKNAFIDKQIYENCSIIYTPKKSLSESRNTLIKYSLSTFSEVDILITIDDDVFISNLLEFYETLKNYIHSINNFEFGCASIVFEDSHKFFSRYARYNLQKKHKPFSMKINDHNLVLGSGLIFSKNILINGLRFDNNLGLGAKFGGSEETDIFLCALETNYKCIYFPNLFIFHPKIKNNQYGFIKMISYGKGRGFTYKKHFSKNRIYFLRAIIISIFYNLFGMFFSIITFNKSMFLNQFGLMVGKILGLIGK